MGHDQKGYSAKIILEEIAGVVPFYKGVKWDELGKNGKQWPVKEDGSDTKILHTDTFKNGKGKFHTWDFEESPEIVANSSKYPYILTTGPVSYTHLRAHETRHDLVCRLLLEKK